MLIRTLTRACGRLNFEPGDEIELPDAEAKDLIDAGAAMQLASQDSDPPELPKPSKTKKG